MVLATMLSREDVYTEGLPAAEPFQRFIDFTLRHAGRTIIDIGCGDGVYAKHLKDLGKQVPGLYCNEAYVEVARNRGLVAYAGDARSTGFPDDHFETALLFEVLEHVPRPEQVLAEALRISQKNVLMTVPNMGEYATLRAQDLTYYHLVTTDHVNFFTLDDFRTMGVRLNADIEVFPSEPINVIALLPGDSVLQELLRRVCHRFFPPVAYNRLYCVAAKNTKTSRRVGVIGS